MGKYLVSTGVALALFFATSSASALSMEEQEQAREMVETLFKTTIELGTMPFGPERWDRQYEIYKDHLGLTSPYNGPRVFSKNWREAGPEDQEYFDRVTTLFISEAWLVRGIKRSVKSLKTELLPYADYLNLSKKTIQGWIADPKTIPLRVENMVANGEQLKLPKPDAENVVRFRVVALPNIIDRIRSGEIKAIGDDHLESLVFYLIVKKDSSSNKYRISDIYQPKQYILRHDAYGAHMFSHLINTYASKTGQFRSTVKRNRRFQMSQLTPHLTQVRAFSDYLWELYLERFTGK